MAYRYTDVNTRTIYDAKTGKVGGTGKIARFWYDAAGTSPVDLGLYSDASPEVAGTSTGSNQLPIQANGMWPAVWDRLGTQDFIYLQVGTAGVPGEMFRIYADADQRLDQLNARYTGLLARVEALEAATGPAYGFTSDPAVPGLVVADDTAPGLSYAAGVLTVDDILAAGVTYAAGVLTVTTV